MVKNSKSAVFALLAAGAVLAGPALAQSLSPQAQAIVAQVAATNDINDVCRNLGRLRTAMEPVVRALIKDGTLSANPRRDAMEAGRYIVMNCGDL